MNGLQKTMGDEFTYMGTAWAKNLRVLYDIHFGTDVAICTDIDVETSITLPWRVSGKFIDYYILNSYTHAYNIHMFECTKDTWGKIDG